MPERGPNVIIILTDDQGYGDLACHGNPVARTPHLDALHGESARLTDFHAAPMCTPTRGQLLTGLDAARNGALSVSSGRSLLRAGIPTMADHFVAAGYRTGLFGKWHLGDNHPYRPEDRGFEETLWFPSWGLASLPAHWDNDYFDDVYRRNGQAEQVPGYCTEVFFQAATSWIRDRVAADEPFLAYLPTNAPHHPLFVPAADREVIEAAFAEDEHRLGEYDLRVRGDIVRFLAMIHNIDREVGKLRAELESLGIADDTVLIFMTDNGSTYGPAYYNAGMRGGKVTLWEGGHRVPCFIHWPGGGLDEGRDIAGLTQMQDILPTLADWCGLDLGDRALDGISLDGVLRRSEPVDDDRVISVNYSRMPTSDYPSPANESIVRREGTAVLWQRWRLLEGVALYDLEADPGQEVDVRDRHPDVAERLVAELDRWWAGVEPLANEPQYVIVGSPRENPSRLTACEWWDVAHDTQYEARIGVRRNSYWHLEVAHPGDYRIALRRWPEELDLALADGCPPGSAVDELDVDDAWYRVLRSAGVALPIAGARVRIAGHDVRIGVGADDRAAVVTVPLEAGRVLLETWFADVSGQPITGAYYVDVERLEDGLVGSDG